MWNLLTMCPIVINLRLTLLKPLGQIDPEKCLFGVTLQVPCPAKGNEHALIWSFPFAFCFCRKLTQNRVRHYPFLGLYNPIPGNFFFTKNEVY